jgi:tubulin polyglutamylase TTLL6/13
VVREVAKELRFKVGREAVGVGEWDLTWTDGVVAPETLAKMRPHQKINHFPGMYNLSRKNYLARNLIKMQKQFPN